MGSTIFLFLALLSSFAWGVEKRPEHAKEIVRTVHRVRMALEKPDAVLAEDLVLIKAQVEKFSANRERISLFAHYLYGRGLLYLDDFYDDMAFLQGGLTDPATADDFRTRLENLSFPSLAKQLASVSMDGVGEQGEWGEPVQGAFDRIGRVEQASQATLNAQDVFNNAGRAATSQLKFFQSAAFLLASAAGVYAAWHTFGIDQMNPREFVGFLFSVWAGNQATYWLIWERFKWIDPYKKWKAADEYAALREAWKELLHLSPSLSAQKAAAAAATKLISTAKHADAQADAALEALFDSLEDEDASNDAAIKEELFKTFLTELEDGNGQRALRILTKLKDADPQSDAALMSEKVARIFQIRARMERKCLIRQTFKAKFRLALLAIAVYASNETLRSILPEHLAHWRTVPNSVLAGLGARRIFPLIWLPHRVDALRRQASKEEVQLRQAFDELIAIDPSGSTVERIAEYDSGAAAHQLVTYAAGDALAANPNGERTRKLWNVVNRELSTSHPAGSRVQDLLEDTYRAQRTCITRMLDAVTGLAGVLGVVNDVGVQP